MKSEVVACIRDAIICCKEQQETMRRNYVPLLSIYPDMSDKYAKEDVIEALKALKDEQYIGVLGNLDVLEAHFNQCNLRLLPKGEKLYSILKDDERWYKASEKITKLNSFDINDMEQILITV